MKKRPAEVGRAIAFDCCFGFPTNDGADVIKLTRAPFVSLTSQMPKPRRRRRRRGYEDGLLPLPLPLQSALRRGNGEAEIRLPC